MSGLDKSVVIETTGGVVSAVETRVIEGDLGDDELEELVELDELDELDELEELEEGEAV